MHIPYSAEETTGAIYGDHGVRFNDDGWPLFPGQKPTSSNLLFWRRDRDLPDPPRETVARPMDTFRYRPYSRRVIPAQRSDVRAAPFVTRRTDDPTTFATTNRVTTMRPEIIVVEEMKIYDEKPCAWWLFITVGILMFILGILNIMWCWQFHWYSRFWTSVLVRILCLQFR